MILPAVLWYTDHDGLAVATDAPPPGAVPYMLAQPMPIESAPRDRTRVLLFDSRYPASEWEIGYWGWLGGNDYGWIHDREDTGDEYRYRPDRWLPLPPSPGEGSKT